MKLNYRAGEVCESRGGRPGLPVAKSPYGLRGREATLDELEHGSVLKVTSQST